MKNSAWHSEYGSDGQRPLAIWNWRSRTLNLLIVMIAALLVSPTLLYQAKAAAGDLDLAFGSNGKVTTDFGGTTDYGNAVVLQADGKIIVAGHAITDYANPGFFSDFALARYNPNGALDTTFGNNGKVTTHFNGGPFDAVDDLALQPDGKIVAAGHAVDDVGGSVDIAVVRYNSNGSLDTAFGNGGKVTTHLRDSSNSASSLVLQPDGKIVIAGATGAIPDIAVVRYNPNGSLDSTFGSNGAVITHFDGGYNVTVSAYDLALQPDGKLVTVGSYIQDYGRPAVFALARYNSDGSLDTAFGNGGEVITNVTGYAETIALQPDGKIIAGGHIRVAQHDNDIELARYNSDGSPDTGFGNNGVVRTTFSSSSDDLARTIALQADGKIIAAGHTGNYPLFDLAIVRYTSDGQLDPGFGSNGKVSTGFFSSWEEANGLAIQPDGNIVMVGEAETPSGLDFALVRYLSPSPCAYSFSSTGTYFPASGGSGSVNLTTGGGCNWAVSCSDNWIMLTSSVSGTGNATITFEVRENFTGSARTATITVGSQTFTLIQDGGLGDDCECSISPTFNSVSASGGSGSVQISNSERCAWQAVSDASWITITSNSIGIGNGTITYTAAANASKSGRKGTITIGKQVFSIKQK